MEIKDEMHKDVSPLTPETVVDVGPSEARKKRKSVESEVQEPRVNLWCLWCFADRMPELSRTGAGILLILLGLALLPIGISVLVASSNLVEYQVRYDNICPLKSNCSLSVIIPETMKAPVFVYYHISGLPQNQRRYVSSRSDPQLAGAASYDVTACDPVETDPSGLRYYGCGLTSFTFFNDAFSLSSGSGLFSGSDWDRRDIAWDSDLETLFVNRNLRTDETRSISRYGSNLILPAIDDQDFVVWMRSSSFSKFRKLYSVIRNQDLVAGSNLNLSISNQFFIENFLDLEKSVIFATISWVGAKNSFLGIASVVCACIYIILGLLTVFIKKPGI